MQGSVPLRRFRFFVQHVLIKGIPTEKCYKSIVFILLVSPINCTVSCCNKSISQNLDNNILLTSNIFHPITIAGALRIPSYSPTQIRIIRQQYFFMDFRQTRRQTKKFKRLEKRLFIRPKHAYTKN